MICAPRTMDIPHHHPMQISTSKTTGCACHEIYWHTNLLQLATFHACHRVVVYKPLTRMHAFRVCRVRTSTLSTNAIKHFCSREVYAMFNKTSTTVDQHTCLKLYTNEGVYLDRTLVSPWSGAMQLVKVYGAQNHWVTARRGRSHEARSS